MTNDGQLRFVRILSKDEISQKVNCKYYDFMFISVYLNVKENDDLKEILVKHIVFLIDDEAV